MIKKFLLYGVLISNIMLFADWEADVHSIKTNTDDIKADVASIGNETGLTREILEIMSVGKKWEYDHETGQVQEVQWGSNYSTFWYEHSITMDHTADYDNYINARKFGNTNTENFTWQLGEGFFGDEFSLKSLDTVAIRLENDLQNGVQAMENATPDIVSGRNTVERAKGYLNSFLNGEYADYTFFVLDLRGLANIFYSDNELNTEGFQSVFSDWIWRINMVPDEVNNPLLFKLHSSYMHFYRDLYGSVVIIALLYIWLIMEFWKKILSVMQMD